MSDCNHELEKAYPNPYGITRHCKKCGYIEHSEWLNIKKTCNQCTWSKQANGYVWCLCPRVKHDRPDQQRADTCFYYERASK